MLPLPRPNPVEKPLRETMFALAVIPVGVGLWMILWKLRRLPGRWSRG
ncbi:hypothetical protein AB4Y86_00245 [Arthrobacter sp. 2YAF22_2]